MAASHSRKFTFLAFCLAAAMILPAAGCNAGGPSKTSLAASAQTAGHTTGPTADTRLENTVDLVFRTAELSGLGNSISNLNHWGMVVGDQHQLFTTEYASSDQEGLQLFVSDESGKRCLTADAPVQGSLNLDDAFVYFVTSEGISRLDRESERVEVLVRMTEISRLMLCQDKLYFIADQELHSFDIRSNLSERLHENVNPRYLDAHQGQVFFCVGNKSDEIHKLYALQPDGTKKELYQYNPFQISPRQVIAEGKLLCLATTTAPPHSSEDPGLDLILLDWQSDEREVLLSQCSGAGAYVNGGQIVAAAESDQGTELWLIDVSSKTKKELPVTGRVGAFNFTADRVILTWVADVAFAELVVQNNLLQVVPLH